MITALTIIALLMTLLMLVFLPWFGWGRGMDAAGKGMVMFFPVIAMSVRALCFGIAMIALASAGGLSWSGMGPLAAGVVGVAFIAATGAVSFISVSLLADAPPPAYSAAPAWLATMAVPAVLAMWLLAETYGAPDTAQLWALRGLLAVVALSPLPFLAHNMRARAADAARLKAERDAEEASAKARVAELPEGTDLAGILAFLETIPEQDWRVRELALQRTYAIEDRPGILMAMLASPDRAQRIRAALHTTNVTMPETAEYFALAQAEIGAIIARLEAKAAPDAELYREGQAAIRLAWPAMHRRDLKKAQMEALAAALEAQGEGSACHALVYDARMLAAYVTG